ncbi:MAG: C2H2-type zinc finger protein [Candidatus Nanohaloarchaeota archaeon QJJ-5]|nr:C2H2-type zinc finger protein [Candidatus Nanohaloarchaeota archaeon QJJ-5]
MDWEENTITTSVDRLLVYLDEEGPTSIATIADDLDVSEQQVEAWTEALISSDMVEKEYSAREGTIVTLKEPKEVEETADAVSSDTGEQMEAVKDQIEHIEEIEEATETLEHLSETFQKSLKAQEEVNDLLQELHKEEKQLEEEIESLDGEEQQLESQALETLEEIEDEIEGYKPAAMVSSFKEEKDSIETRLKTLKDLKDSIEDIEAEKKAAKECPVCGRTFETEHGLRTHQGIKHPDYEPESEENDDGNGGFIGRIKGLFS